MEIKEKNKCSGRSKEVNLGNYDRLTDDGRTDRPTDRTSHRKVSLPLRTIIEGKFIIELKEKINRVRRRMKRREKMVSLSSRRFFFI